MNPQSGWKSSAKILLPPKKNLKSSFPLRFPPIGRAGPPSLKLRRVNKARRAEGGCGGIPLADLSAEVSTQAGPSQFRSDIFKQTPPFDSRERGEWPCVSPAAGGTNRRASILTRSRSLTVRPRAHPSIPSSGSRDGPAEMAGA